MRWQPTVALLGAHPPKDWIPRYVLVAADARSSRCSYPVRTVLSRKMNAPARGAAEFAASGEMHVQPSKFPSSDGIPVPCSSEIPRLSTVTSCQLSPDGHPLMVFAAAPPSHLGRDAAHQLSSSSAMISAQSATHSSQMKI
jgi:hypothetical protein